MPDVPRRSRELTYLYFPIFSHERRVRPPRSLRLHELYLTAGQHGSGVEEILDFRRAV